MRVTLQSATSSAIPPASPIFPKPRIRSLQSTRLVPALRGLNTMAELLARAHFITGFKVSRISLFQSQTSLWQILGNKTSCCILSISK